jgi:hypothetical protein
MTVSLNWARTNMKSVRQVNTLIPIGGSQGAATVKVPLKRRAVEVTGIKDAPFDKDSKVVQFTWEYVDVPEPVNRYTGTTAGLHSGEALFKLYDDGWRIEGLQVN